MNFKLPGQLIVDEINHNQLLKLYSKVDLNGIPIDSPNCMVEHAKYSTIFGDCENGNKITLNDCVFHGANHIGDDLYEIIYKPSFSFRGSIFIEQNKTKIKSLVCTFPYFSSWFDTDRLFFGCYSQTYTSECPTDDFSENMKRALSSDELCDEIKINDDFSIFIERIYHQDTLSSTKEVKAEIKHFVHFTSSTGKSFEELKTLAHNFMQLIQLSTGELMYVNFVSAIIKKEDQNDFSKNQKTHNGDVFLSINHFNYLHKRNLVKSDKTNRNYMLFYGGQNHSDKLKAIIIKWYNSIEKSSSIYNIFLDTYEWFQNTDAFLTQTMFNNRFVNLVQAIERYHKFSFPNLKYENAEEVNIKKQEILKLIINPKDNEWLAERIKPRRLSLNKRIEYILNHELQDISLLLFLNKENMESYVEQLIKLRNALSHGEKIEIDVSEISDYYYKTLIILLSCILLNLGFTQTEIKEALNRTLQYSVMIRYIKSRL